MRPYISELVAPLLGNRCFYGSNLCFARWGVVLMLAPKYELDRTTQYWVIAIFS